MDRTGSGPDWAAVVLLAAAIAFSCLYPEAFITGTPPLIGSSRLAPLNLLFPFLAIGAVGYAVVRRRLVRPGPMDVAVLAFLAFVAARNIASPDVLVSLKYLVYGGGTYYLAALLTARGKPFSRALIWVVAGITVLTAVYGFAEYAAQHNLIYHQYIQETVREPVRGLHRIGSTLAHPVAYAGFLVQTIPFCILAWVRAKSWRGRLPGAAATVIASFALFLTYSKGSWIVAVALAGAGVLVLMKKNRRQAMVAAVISLTAILLLTVAFWQEINLETSTRAGESVSGRLVAWEAAIDGITDHWPLGVGLGKGKTEMLKNVDPHWRELADAVMPVDNYYLSVLLEEGIIGLALFLTAIALILREAVACLRCGGPDRTLALAALASIIGILLNALTFDALLLWPNYVLFWVAAGMLHGTVWQSGLR